MSNRRKGSYAAFDSGVLMAMIMLRIAIMGSFVSSLLSMGMIVPDFSSLHVTRGVPISVAFDGGRSFELHAEYRFHAGETQGDTWVDHLLELDDRYTSLADRVEALMSEFSSSRARSSSVSAS